MLSLIVRILSNHDKVWVLLDHDVHFQVQDNYPWLAQAKKMSESSTRYWSIELCFDRPSIDLESGVLIPTKGSTLAKW